MTTDDDVAGFRTTLRRKGRLRECLALAAVPAVLVGVYLLPEATRRGLAFAYDRPTVLTAYTAHFVHLSLDHLLANVTGYVLLAGGGYVLAVLADARRLFGVAAVTYLLAFPFALSGLNLAVPRDAVGYGFSGVSMAFAGLFAAILAVYAGRRLHPGVGVRHAPVGFLLVIALGALLVPAPGWIATALAGAAVLGALGYAVSAAGTVRSAKPHPTAREAGWPDLFALGTALLLGYPFAAFPPELRAGTAVVNAYVHLLGFCLAFLVAYVAAELGVVEVDSTAERTGHDGT